MTKNWSVQRDFQTSNFLQDTSKSTEDGKLKTKTPTVLICSLYQRGERCKFKDDHYAYKNGKYQLQRHICQRCYSIMGEEKAHPKESRLCHARGSGFESFSSPAKMRQAVANLMKKACKVYIIPRYEKFQKKVNFCQKKNKN